MAVRLTFTIELQSDYHVGAGQGAGMTVDSALLRDYDNAPALRGTILAGLLKDGLADLKHLVEGASQLNFSPDIDAAADRLFGNPRQRKRWAYSSARPVGNYDAAETTWGAQPVTRVRIDPRARRAAPQQLFTEEEGDRRLQFQFTAVCETANAQDQADAVLLAAASRLARHLGGARRRGRGECLFTLKKVEGLASQPAQKESWLDHALDLFKQHWLEGKPLATADANPNEEKISLTLSGKRRRFLMVAYAKEPLVLAYRSQTANAFDSLPYVPGTAVLGALAARAAYQMGIDGDSNPPAEFVQLFTRGAVRASGLLPVRYQSPDDLYPTIAAPAALWQCENRPHYTVDGPSFDLTRDEYVPAHPLHNGLSGEIPENCPECGGKLKQVAGFVSLQKEPFLQRPHKREEMHIELDRESGRVKEGQLYEYIALEAGQWFAGELDCDDGAWSRLAQLTALKIGEAVSVRLGRAARRGYGLVRFYLRELDDQAASSFVTIPLAARQPQVADGKASFSLLLLTDAIVADSWGRFYRSFAPEWVAEALGVTPQQVRVEKSFASSRLVDNFNTHRQMPRWRDEALAAGSAAQIVVSGITDEKVFLARLAELEKEGIGLRRHEGFGRTAVNHPLLNAKPQFKRPLAYDEAAEILLPPLGFHPLIEEAKFVNQWRTTLLDHKANHSGRWGNLAKPGFNDVARLLFLYRFLPADELQSWLGQLGESKHLWGGKTFVGREKEPKLETAGVKLVQELAKLAKSEATTAEQYALALEILAEQIDAVAPKQEGHNG